MIKNVIFDWSGVINDNTFAVYQTANEIFKTFGSQIISFDEFRREFKVPYMNFYNQYLPNLTIEDQKIEFKKSIVKFDKNLIYTGIDKSIKKFFNNKLNLFVVSGDHPETLLNQIKLFGLDELFKEVIYDSHDKAIDVEFLIKKYNLVLEDTIFIGDSNHEIEVGQKLGIKTGAVTWGFSPEENLKSFNPDFMIHNLTELERVILK